MKYILTLLLLCSFSLSFSKETDVKEQQTVYKEKHKEEKEKAEERKAAKEERMRKLKAMDKFRF